MFVYTDGQGLKEWVWGVRVKEVWGRSKGMDGLQASHTHLTGCLAVQDALDRQVEKMALSALVGQLPCPASPLFAQKAHERSANVGTGADHLRVTELGLSPPRPVWLLPPPSTQSIGGEANMERWVVWGPSLGLQPAPPLGTSVCVCARACVCACVHTRQSLGRVRLSVTPQTAARQAPLSMGFSRQEYSVGCHLLPQGPAEGTLVLAAVFLAVGSLPESLLQLTLTPPRWPLTKDPRGGTPTRPGLPVSGIQTGDLRAQPSVSDVFSAGSR